MVSFFVLWVSHFNKIVFVVMSFAFSSTSRTFYITIIYFLSAFVSSGIFSAVFLLDCLAQALLLLKLPNAVKTVLELVGKLATVVKVGCLLLVRIFILPLCLGKNICTYSNVFVLLLLF